MRGRRSGLLPIEQSILEVGVRLRREGSPEFHGFMVAAQIREAREARLLTARGTLYKALDRLERRGLLASRWEDADIAMSEGRPRRRLYRVTAAGESALAELQRPRALTQPVPGTST
jgi:DNA-binding PadR family transcriptional regulator